MVAGHYRFSSIEPPHQHFDIKGDGDDKQVAYVSKATTDPRDQSSGPETDPDTKIEPSKDLPEPLTKKSSNLININRVVIDNLYLGRENEIPELIDEYVEAYLAGGDVPPIRVERNTNKLVDGHHRYKALLRIWELIKQSEVASKDVNKAFVSDLINVEYVDIPEGIAPCLFSVNFNMSHGQKASTDDIKAAVREQFKMDKSFTAKKLAACIGLSEDTARRYCEEPNRERKEEIRKFIVKSDEQEKSQEQIEKELHEIYSDVPGTSQATISKILSENRNVAKTDEIEPVKTETDPDSSPVENTPTITDEENSEETCIRIYSKRFRFCE